MNRDAIPEPQGHMCWKTALRKDSLVLRFHKPAEILLGDSSPPT